MDNNFHNKREIFLECNIQFIQHFHLLTDFWHKTASTTTESVYHYTTLFRRSPLNKLKKRCPHGINVGPLPYHNGR